MNKIFILLAATLLFAGAAFAKKSYRITIVTDSGTIVLKLYDNTPLNSKNMVKLAKQHFYDSTLFHRCIPAFVIQGGDPQSKHAQPGAMLGNGELDYKVPAEINETDFHKRGALGVARDNTPDKSGSACQFYIVVGRTVTDADLDRVTTQTGRKFTTEQRETYKTLGGTPHLDGNYTVFGEVVSGMDVVDKIAGAKRDRADRPLTDIRMISVRAVRKKHFLFF